MEASEERRRKRLLYRSTHRGTKEADLILGGFARAHLATMSAEEITRFERLLEESDPDLMAWVSGSMLPPPQHDTELLTLIKNFKKHRPRN